MSSTQTTPFETAVLVATSGLVVGRDGRSVARLDDLSLAAGDAILLLGPSGSGKTTALFTLAGLLAPLAGVVALDGASFSGRPVAERDAIRGRRIGMVFQDGGLIAGLSVLDTVLLGPFAVGRPQDRDRATELLERLGLKEVGARRVETLSRGEAQRVGLARALQMRPAVLLADEPSASLDDRHADQVADLLLETARDAGAALIVATHDRRLKRRIPRSVTIGAAP